MLDFIEETQHIIIMKIIILLFPAFILILGGCCSSRNSACQIKATKSDSVITQNLPKNVARISSNSSRIVIVLDSLRILDEERFKLFATLVSEVDENSELPTPDLGKELELLSDYYLDDNGKIDRSHERNIRLHRIRNFAIGNKIEIRIMRDELGTLHVLDLIK
jgi:hypothetical protein